MNKPEDILQFVEEWRSIKGIADDVMLTCQTADYLR